MDENSKKYTAFCFPGGFYEFNVMPMGLSNACATFQRMMDTIFADEIGKISYIYIDDIIIYSSTLEQHILDVKRIVEILKQNNLKIKLKKSENKIACTKIMFLSHVIENGEIKPSPMKIQALLDFQRPKNLTTLKSFLGYASWHRKFIQNFAKHASPLIRLSEKETPWIWDQDCEAAFNYLKTYLSSDSVLALYRQDLPIEVECDASDYGIGGIVTQPHNGQQKSVGCFIRHLSKAERKYPIPEKELQAIVETIEYFKQILYGRKFVVITDHQPLQYLLKMNKPSPRLERWLARLEQYDFVIKYRPGKLNSAADGLSRWCFDDQKAIKAAEDVEPYVSLTINSISLTTDKINEEQLQDPDLTWLYSLILDEVKTGLKSNKIVLQELSNKRKSLYLQFKKNRFIISGKNIFRVWLHDDLSITHQYVVPNHQIKYLMEMAHSSAYACHLGFDKTLARLKENCYWYNQVQDVKAFCINCTTCQQIKPPKHYLHAPLQPIQSYKPFQLVTSDIVGPLPETPDGNKYILIIIDHFTKYLEVQPIKTLTADELTKKFHEYFTRYGIPESVLSDQGKNYQSETLQQALEVLDVHYVCTTPYHPQADGNSERANRTIQQMLTAYVSADQRDWDQHLPSLQLAYNSAVHSTTKCTPFELVFGRRVRF